MKDSRHCVARRNDVYFAPGLATHSQPDSHCPTVLEGKVQETVRIPACALGVSPRNSTVFPFMGQGGQGDEGMGQACARLSRPMAWQLRSARAEDLPSIRALVASVGGDEEDLQPDQFVVARDDDGTILGCGRLKPYPDCTELASIAVAPESRASGIGRAIVRRLLELHRGPIHLLCEDDVVEFFHRYGFELIPSRAMPPGLATKREHYASVANRINIMRRD